MENDEILKRIKNLEFVSGALATLAPILGILIGGDKKWIVFLSLLGIAVIFQAYIYSLYKNINQEDKYVNKKFWPLVTSCFFVIFLVLENHYHWLL